MQYLVDENGEVKEIFKEDESVARLKKGERGGRGGRIEYFLGTITVKFNQFLKVNDLACLELKKYGDYIFLLFQYVGFADGILSFSNGRRLRPKFLYGLLGNKRKNGSTVVKELVELEVLHKHKDNRTYYFTFNPYIAVKVNRITKELYEEFKDSKYKTLGDNLLNVSRIIEER